MNNEPSMKLLLLERKASKSFGTQSFWGNWGCCDIM